MSTQAIHRAEVNSGYVATGSPTEPTGMIIQQANRLESSISYANELVNILQEKIKPILAIEMATSKGDCQAVPEQPATNSAMTYTFTELRDKVDCMATKLNELIERIEL